jgi:hypothetical protein
LVRRKRSLAMPVDKRSQEQISCPVCGATYRLTQWTMMKMLRKPKCQRCGADLTETLKAKLQRRLISAASGQVTCPRCNQSQDPAPYCKWCGNPLEKVSVPKQEERPVPAFSFPWLRLLSTAVVLLFLVMIPFLQEMQVPQALEESRAFLLEEDRLANILGGKLKWGPIPFFFWRSVEGSSERWKGSFYFLAQGPKTTAVAIVKLEKLGRSVGRWKVVEGSYALDTNGNRIPIPHRSPPKPKLGA